MERIFCDRCSSDNFVEDEAGRLMCVYCRAVYKKTPPEPVKKVTIDGADRVEELLSKAQRCLDDGDTARANKIINLVLELDPKNPLTRLRIK